MLKVQNLELVYNDVINAVKSSSLEVPEGQIVTLLGPNGAGKTSLLRAVAGILRSHDAEITGGQVYLGDIKISGLSPEEIFKQGIFLIPEGGGLFEDLTTQENLRIGIKNASGSQVKEGIEKVWNWFPNLEKRANIRAGYLSGGEQQMLALGRAILVKPKILMLDEPSLGLAPLIVEELFAFIKRLNSEEGISILLIEQNARKALEVASYGYIMENGKIVFDAPAAELVQDKEIQEFYLGTGKEAKRRNYREVKHFKRKKRWLS